MCKVLDNGKVVVKAPMTLSSLIIPNVLWKKITDTLGKSSVSRATLVATLGVLLFNTLSQHGILLPSVLTHSLSRGIISRSKKPAGAHLDLTGIDNLHHNDVVIIHAPIHSTDGDFISVKNGGLKIRSFLNQTLPSFANGSLRQGRLIDQDFGTQIPTSEVRLTDAGNIIYQPHADCFHDVGLRLFYFLQFVMAQRGRPIILGGDHAQAYYTIGALAETHPKLGILQFDAHTDLYSMGGPADNIMNHANVMHWVRQMKHVNSIWQVGIRDVSFQSTERLSGANDPKIQTISAYEIAIHGYDRLLDQVDVSIPWFISFDVDVLACADRPQTATPVLGGLDYYPLLSFFERLLARVDIIGMEFVEIGDATPTAHGPAAVATRLITRYLFHLRNAQPNNENIYL